MVVLAVCPRVVSMGSPPVNGRAADGVEIAAQSSADRHAAPFAETDATGFDAAS
ncbi:hypothetical protein GCM10027294_37470 [Marinactinospora endophytica]